MDELWVKVIKITGAVSVIAFLVYTLFQYIYSDRIVALFGGEKLFVITIFLTASLVIILAVSILWAKKSTSHKFTTQPKAKVVYRDQSTHHGDNNF